MNKFSSALIYYNTNQSIYTKKQRHDTKVDLKNVSELRGEAQVKEIGF
jgi:hypothetical protein